MGALANDVKRRDRGGAAPRRRERSGGERLARAARRGAPRRHAARARARPRGHVHPLARDRRTRSSTSSSRWASRVDEGPEIEDEFHNFDALNFPADHPARDMQDTFFVDAGRDVLLRTHTSPVQIRVMRIEHAAAARDRSRRRSTGATSSTRRTRRCSIRSRASWSTTHVTFADLKGVLTHFLQRLFGADTRVRFRPSFFPFTEPCAEVDIGCVRCGARRAPSPPAASAAERVARDPRRRDDPPERAARCRLRSRAPCRASPSAWASTASRCCRYGIDDLRLFYENDLRFLGQF